MSRKNLSLFVTGTLIVAAAVACGHKVDKAKNDKAGSTTTTNKPQDPKNPKNPQILDNNDGLPGSIIINVIGSDQHWVGPDRPIDAAFADKSVKVSASQAVMPTIEIKIAADADKLPGDDVTSLKNVKARKTLMNIGCSEAQLSALSASGLDTIKPDEMQDDGILSLSANTIAICGELPKAAAVFVTADTLLLANASTSLNVNATHETVTIRANRLILNGENKIQVNEAGAAATKEARVTRIYLTVAEKLDAEKDATLRLTTKGSKKLAAAAPPQETPEKVPAAVSTLQRSAQEAQR